MTLTTKHQRLAALRPLSPESVASLAAAWDVRMVTSPDLQLACSGQDARHQADHFTDLSKMIPNPQP